jgi:hypothetical protein
MLRLRLPPPPHPAPTRRPAAPRRRFSDVVACAKQLGYTEPDPREDLSGADVARKVVILARECGMQVRRLLAGGWQGGRLAGGRGAAGARGRGRSSGALRCWATARHQGQGGRGRSCPSALRGGGGLRPSCRSALWPPPHLPTRTARPLAPPAGRAGLDAGAEPGAARAGGAAGRRAVHGGAAPARRPHGSGGGGGPGGSWGPCSCCCCCWPAAAACTAGQRMRLT